MAKGSTFSFHIWVELPVDCESCVRECKMGGSKEEPQEIKSLQKGDEDSVLQKLSGLTVGRVSENIWKYGEPENKEELEKKLSKLILSVEMENWEKAEMFAETVKQLVEEAPREIKSAALRMKMAVQKGDYEKAITAFENLRNMI